MINYQEAMKIDESRLDKEWSMQAGKLMSLVEVEAAASAQISELKEKRDVVRAELAQKYRKDAETSGKKLTETALDELIVLDRTFSDIKKQIIKAEYERDLVSGACQAMSHRKAALENLVQLLLRSDRAEPKTFAANKEAAKEALDRGRMAGHETRPPKKVG